MAKNKKRRMPNNVSLGTRVHGDTSYNRREANKQAEEIIDEALTRTEGDKLLKQLFESIQPHDKNNYSSYETNTTYVTAEDHKIITFNAPDKIILKKDQPRLALEIATIEDQPSRLVYMGSDVQEMMQNLDNLRLPSYSQNLGETIFRVFGQHLEEIESGPAHIEGKIEPGREQELEFLLKKQLYVWDNGPVDEAFYSDI